MEREPEPEKRTQKGEYSWHGCCWPCWKPKPYFGFPALWASIFVVVFVIPVIVFLSLEIHKPCWLFILDTQVDLATIDTGSSSLLKRGFQEVWEDSGNVRWERQVWDIMKLYEVVLLCEVWQRTQAQRAQATPCPLTLLQVTEPSTDPLVLSYL